MAGQVRLCLPSWVRRFPARGLYVTEPELADLDAVVARWATTAAPLIRGALAGYEASDA
jgi:hypothetical protein